MQQTTQTEPAPNFGNLDEHVERTVQGHRRNSSGNLAAELAAAFSVFGFATKPHQNGTKTAVIGVHPEHHAKVQAVMDSQYVVYTRHNGRAYNLDESPAWDSLLSDATVYKSYKMGT